MTTYEKILREYELTTAATKYYFGFDYHGDMYGLEMTFSELSEMFKQDRAAASKGGMVKVRIRSTREQRITLVHSGRAVLIGKVENIHAEESKYNAGTQFEKWVAEVVYGLEWQVDSTPYWVAGDLTVNGEQVQVKFDGATLTDERATARAMRERIA